VSPLRGEKSIFVPMSKNNTGMAARTPVFRNGTAKYLHDSLND